MGTVSWERTAVVTVGAPGQIGSAIEGARVTFTIEKTSRSSANSSTITVYNLGEANRSRFQSKGNSISLQVGYGDVLELLFSGQIRTGKVRWEPPEWIAEAECLDGQEAMKGAVYAKTFPAGTPRLTVVRALTSALTGIASGAIETGPFAGALSAPLSVQGSVRRSLDARANDWGFTWSIQDGVVELRELGKRTPGYYTAVLLTPTTGLLGSPEWTDDGLSVRALLNASIRPGGYVRVESREVKGTFRVQSATYAGDTMGQEWTTEAICQEVTV